MLFIFPIMQPITTHYAELTVRYKVLLYFRRGGHKGGRCSGRGRGWNEEYKLPARNMYKEAATPNLSLGKGLQVCFRPRPPAPPAHAPCFGCPADDTPPRPSKI